MIRNKMLIADTQNPVRTLLWVGYCQNVASTARERAKCEHLQDGWCDRPRLADRPRLCRLLCGRGARRRRRPLEPIPLICLGCGLLLLLWEPVLSKKTVGGC